MSRAKSNDKYLSQFESAYTIKGKGVGVLKLGKAKGSESFRVATKKLIAALEEHYPDSSKDSDRSKS